MISKYVVRHYKYSPKTSKNKCYDAGWERETLNMAYPWWTPRYFLMDVKTVKPIIGIGKTNPRLTFLSTYLYFGFCACSMCMAKKLSLEPFQSVSTWMTQQNDWQFSRLKQFHEDKKKLFHYLWQKKSCALWEGVCKHPWLLSTLDSTQDKITSRISVMDNVLKMKLHFVVILVHYSTSNYSSATAAYSEPNTNCTVLDWKNFDPNSPSIFYGRAQGRLGNQLLGYAFLLQLQRQH